jgi:hypothetical protein
MGHRHGADGQSVRLRRESVRGATAKEAIERGRAGGRKTERERYFIEAVAEYFDSLPRERTCSA